MSPESVYPIRAVARRTGLSTHVIRMWEHRYRAVTPARTPTRRRLYSEADIERLRLLREATRHGHAIGGIAVLPTERLIELLRGDGGPLSRPTIVSGDASDGSEVIERCLAAVDGFDAERLQAELARARNERSLATWIEQLAAPLLEVIGERWRQGSLRAAHEHLASMAIRDTLARVDLRRAAGDHGERLVVGTPAGQLHELGAMAVAAIAASRGWSVTYLGSNLASDDIVFAAKSCDARAVALSIAAAEDLQLPRDMAALQAGLGRSIALWLGGRGCDAYAGEWARLKIPVFRDLSQLRRELERVRG